MRDTIALVLLPHYHVVPKLTFTTNNITISNSNLRYYESNRQTLISEHHIKPLVLVLHHITKTN